VATSTSKIFFSADITVLASVVTDIISARINALNLDLVILFSPFKPNFTT
jgi:hypothetical protein